MTFQIIEIPAQSGTVSSGMSSMSDMASMLDSLGFPSEITSAMMGTSTKSSVASEDTSSMGSSLSAMLDTLKQLRTETETRAKATHPCEAEAEKYDCSTVSCLAEHASDLSATCTAYLQELLEPSPEPIEVVTIPVVVSVPSPSPQAVGYVSVQTTDEDGTVTIEEHPIYSSSSLSSPIASLFGPMLSMPSLLSSMFSSSGFSLSSSFPSSYVASSSSSSSERVAYASGEDADFYFSYASEFYDYLDSLFYGDSNAATFFSSLYDEVADEYTTTATSASAPAKKGRSRTSSSSTTTTTAYEEAPSYPCQFEIEALCARYSTRSTLESCLLNHYDSLSSSCKCFLGQTGATPSARQSSAAQPLDSPRLRTIATKVAHAFDSKDLVVDGKEALVVNDDDEDDYSSSSTHRHGHHLTCLLMLFGLVVLTTFAIRRCCCTPRATQFAAVVAPPKRTMVISNVPIVHHGISCEAYKHQKSRPGNAGFTYTIEKELPSVD